MKYIVAKYSFNFSLLIFLVVSGANAEIASKDTLLNALDSVNADILFLRHALAPGFGDPANFDLKDCDTQRNLDAKGRTQAAKIGEELRLRNIKFTEILSSQWCRCKETAEIAFKNYETKNFLNSFFSAKFAKNRKQQVIDFNKFLKTWDQKQNIIFVTHYVVISELLNYAPSSGEIVISDKNLKVIDTLEIEY